MTARRAGKRPPQRTTRVELNSGGAWDGWYAVVRCDFPLRVLNDLQSGNVQRMGDAFDMIVVEHNLPDLAGEVAASMLDVDPYDGMLAVMGEALDAIGKLPPR